MLFRSNADIRKMNLYAYEGGLSYPGDGWVRRESGSMMPKKKDVGRPEGTNYLGQRRS